MRSVYAVAEAPADTHPMSSSDRYPKQPAARADLKHGVDEYHADIDPVSQVCPICHGTCEGVICESPDAEYRHYEESVQAEEDAYTEHEVFAQLMELEPGLTTPRPRLVNPKNPSNFPE